MDQLVEPNADQTAADITIKKSTCRMCHGGCGVNLHIQDERIIKVEGDPDNPMNKGALCPLGASSLEQIYNPKRLKYPMRRVGERGEGKWERISWDEAYDEMVAKIKETQAEYGEESIWIGTGTGRHHFAYVSRFANAIGTPNWCEPGTAQCFRPRVHGSILTMGQLPICVYTNEEMPELIMFWGHNPLYSSPDGEMGFGVKEALARKPKTIVVDPRETMLAKRADIWLQLRPGTDDALALAMLNVIIEEDLIDHDFVAEWTHGFEELAERVKQYTPEWAEPITWCKADQIREAARLYATVKPSMLEWGCAIEHTPACFQTVRALLCLPAITGNIDQPGSWAFGMTPIPPFPQLFDKMPKEQQKKRLGYEDFKVLSGVLAQLPSAHIPTLFKAIRESDPYPVRAGFIFGNNALSTYGEVELVYETLKALDYLVVAELYMTPTAELADLILPVSTWAEVDTVVAVPFYGQNVISVQQKTIQYAECIQDEVIMTEICRRLGVEHCTEDPEEVFDYLLGDQLGLTFKELKEKGWVQPEFKYRKYEENGFKTPTGKIELYSTLLEGEGIDPLPYFEEPPESPYSTPELAEEYPFILITGARIPMFFQSEYRSMPSLRKGRPEPECELHPDTAEALGVKGGDWVSIETERGRCRQKVKIFKGIDPKVVHAQHGWWFPEEEDSPDHGNWRSNANTLTSMQPPYCNAMGTYQLRALLCKVLPVEQSEEPWRPDLPETFDSNVKEIQDWD
ncbi:MAG: molybdopterin-dependent oxidoreductase [Rhodospirillaceae bacterium]|jgi:anaerobic selenocysteine-containing dehydrogenase|nr:molybdopterin-dependent oxidoreductase [Rhodospirillaceae bacterium]MBT5938691.1 molybdopterin-dependent oxidoreductase [Rhodospirillaceae bacterium]MBT7268637.1 molybdopterin-dependent oxidoreductase [Rhodospirillaceae bacterium]